MIRKIAPKGAALLMVLAVLLVVVVLASVILKNALTQANLSRRHLNRIRAQYAAQAGMNYALEMLKIGLPAGWAYVPINSCPKNTPCSIPGEPNLQNVRIVFCDAGDTCAPSATLCNPPAGINFCINSTAN